MATEQAADLYSVLDSAHPRMLRMAEPGRIRVMSVDDHPLVLTTFEGDVEIRALHVVIVSSPPLRPARVRQELEATHAHFNENRE
jgi:hypothetical protein